VKQTTSLWTGRPVDPPPRVFSPCAEFTQQDVSARRHAPRTARLHARAMHAAGHLAGLWQTRPSPYLPGSHRTPSCVGTIRSRDVVAIVRHRASSLTPHHPASSTPEPPHGSTSPSPATSSPPLQPVTAEKRLRRPQIHRAAVLHRRSILRPPDCLKWDPR
jgi:hypothetical protein